MKSNFSLYLDETRKTKLKALASKKHQSLNGLLMSMIDNYLEQNTPQALPETPMHSSPKIELDEGTKRLLGIKE